VRCAEPLQRNDERLHQRLGLLGCAASTHDGRRRGSRRRRG
jgi:hypothetical protein